MVAHSLRRSLQVGLIGAVRKYPRRLLRLAAATDGPRARNALNKGFSSGLGPDSARAVASQRRTGAGDDGGAMPRVWLAPWLGPSRAGARSAPRSLDQLWFSDQQIGEAHEQRQPLMILGQAAVTHPRFRGARLLSYPKRRLMKRNGCSTLARSEARWRSRRASGLSDGSVRRRPGRIATRHSTVDPFQEPLAPRLALLVGKLQAAEHRLQHRGAPFSGRCSDPNQPQRGDLFRPFLEEIKNLRVDLCP